MEKTKTNEKYQAIYENTLVTILSEQELNFRFKEMCIKTHDQIKTINKVL